MGEKTESLFSELAEQKTSSDQLSPNNQVFSIAYDGPALTTGRMDAILLADGLKGTARFVNRIAEMQLGSQSGFQVLVVGEPRSGSLEVVLAFVNPVSTLLHAVSDSKDVDGLLKVIALAGFATGVGKSIIWCFKQLKGRPITEPNDIALIQAAVDILDIRDFIRIYNDPDVQASLRAALGPLRKPGFETYQTRIDHEVVESVFKADVTAADSAELDAIVADEDKVLDIEKASFVPHLAWHLSDQGKPFDAKIQDQALWDSVAAGDRFGYGDRLHVLLHTEAEREPSGRLRYTRTVTKVRRIERTVAVQTPLPISVEPIGEARRND